MILIRISEMQESEKGYCLFSHVFNISVLSNLSTSWLWSHTFSIFLQQFALQVGARDNPIQALMRGSRWHACPCQGMSTWFKPDTADLWWPRDPRYVAGGVALRAQRQGRPKEGPGNCQWCHQGPYKDSTVSSISDGWICQWLSVNIPTVQNHSKNHKTAQYNIRTQHE